MLFDEKMAVQHCPMRDTQDENHASSSTQLKYETPKKKQQPQSKPSYTSQAKADSLPEVNNIIKVQSTLPPTPNFFSFNKIL